MKPLNAFDVLQEEYKYLQSTLELEGTDLIGHLFANKVLSHDQMDLIEKTPQKSKKVRILVGFLIKRPTSDFKHLMKGLAGDQGHVKDHLQDRLEKLETANTEVEMGEHNEDMDEDTAEDRNVDDDEEVTSGSEDEDSEEDSGCPRMNLADIKTAPKIPHLVVFVTVVERNETEMRNGKEQFMAEVADTTSAVDICVTNGKVFDKFKVNSGLILENVSWSGNVLFLHKKSNATSTTPIEIDSSLVKEAFGREEVVSIKKALALQPRSWVALKGKIVKQSFLTKRYSFGKLLTHRQIKLADRSGSGYVDIWEDEAVNLESGDVIHMTGCKRKKYESVDESSVTTTRKTNVKKLKKTEFGDINIAQGFAKGTLEDTEVEMYKSCPKPGCYNFEHDDNDVCESCGSPVRRPDCYATAHVIVTTPKDNIRTLTVFWPQLRELYSLFDKEISLQSGKPTIEDWFQYLRGKTVRYQTCGNVTKFRL
ncbi:uncharacterized protein LOC124267500 isoform X2 [Haliotis rubra]|uniref:uncharacterized protein LOC124267500 isoform X2 n=1 Tax=Haliotis rubra TaxID=36100 RepID=UPI001EE61206|nr:uncharacterized protein LOC124267500 isoform X2 [Haliotis rubra]